MRCRSCDAPISPGDRFCQNCGVAVAPLEEGAGTEPPPRSKVSGAALIGLGAILVVIAVGLKRGPEIRSWVTAGMAKTPPVATPPPNTQAGTLSEGTGTKATPSLPISKATPVPPPPLPPPPPPASALLTQQLLGSWRGGRHLTEYRANGTFVLDADIVPEPAGGVWKLEGNRLTQTYREGNGFTLTIESIKGREMTTVDSATGKTFQLHREDITRLGFDQVRVGSITGNEFLAQGVRLAALQGALFISATAPSMVMPGGHRQLLMVSGDRVTEMAFTFDPPVLSFTITLPGIAAGSSFPTYRLTAYNRAGQGFKAIGQEHWIPARAVPVRITLNPGEMSRVVLSVDNRFGNTAWATYNCLPIAEIEIER